MNDDCCCGAGERDRFGGYTWQSLVKLSTVAILAAWALAAFEARRVFAGSEPGQSCLADQPNRC